MSDEPTVLHWADRHKKRQPAATPVVIPVSNGHANGHSRGYGPAALAGELDILLQTPEGERNHQLNKSTFKLAQLVASGHLDETDVLQQLRAAAQQIGLDPREIEGTLRSGHSAGAQLPRDVPPLVKVAEVGVLDIAPAAPTADSETPDERTSWWPQPIAHRAAQAAETPAPTHLIRNDGQALFYSGKVNGLIGESESGKSWVALLAVAQAVNADQKVLILDFEDTAGSIGGRLRAMGCTPAQLELIHYADPHELLGLVQRNDLQEALGNSYSVIVADGINAAMTLLGYDLNSNTDATVFATTFLRPMARTGACVITVDHVPKNPDARGKGGIGAQAKRAMQDGTCLVVEVINPFGRGHSGVLKLTVDKDRNGAVRGISGDGKFAGRAHIDSVGDQVRLHIDGPDLRPDDEREHWRPTGLMEKVSQLLEGAAQPMSGREITDVTPGRAQNVRQAISELLAAGCIVAERRSGKGGGDVYRSASTFRESDSTEVRPTASQVRPGRGSVSASHPTPPFGDGTHYDGPVDAPENLSASRTQIDKQTAIDLPDGYSNCNQCGQQTPDETIDQTGGFCTKCGWANR